MQWIIKWFFCHCRSTPRYMAQVECRNSSPKTSTAFMKLCSWHLDLPMILLLVSRTTVTSSMVGTSTTLILIVSGWPSNTIRHDSVKTLYSSPKSQQSLSKHGNNLSIIVYFLLSYMNVWIECYLQSRKKHWYKKHVVSVIESTANKLFHKWIFSLFLIQTISISTKDCVKCNLCKETTFHIYDIYSSKYMWQPSPPFRLSVLICALLFILTHPSPLVYGSYTCSASFWNALAKNSNKSL